MYLELILKLRSIAIVVPVLWATGFIGLIGAFVFFVLSYCSFGNEAKVWVTHLIFGFVCSLMFFGSLVIGMSPAVDPKWVIAVEAAKELDKYNESHPDSNFTTSALIGTADNIVEGITETVLGIPELIKLVSSTSTASQRAEIFDQRELERLKRENAELRANQNN
jgi:hypothetical protein